MAFEFHHRTIWSLRNWFWKTEETSLILCVLVLDSENQQKMTFPSDGWRNVTLTIQITEFYYEYQWSNGNMQKQLGSRCGRYSAASFCVDNKSEMSIFYNIFMMIWGDVMMWCGHALIFTASSKTHNVNNNIHYSHHHDRQVASYYWSWSTDK